jgi:predicted transcriptional regulator
MEEQLAKERFVAAVAEGLRDIDEGRTRSIETVYSEMKAKYGL